jgi:hypothetical protein
MAAKFTRRETAFVIDRVDRLLNFIELTATDGASAIRILPAGHQMLSAFLSLIVKDGG